MKSYPLTAPAVSARRMEWSSYLETASDMELVECWQAAVSEQEESLVQLIGHVGFGRFAMRAIAHAHAIQFSSIEVATLSCNQ